ncbi:hypothetical protein JOC95_000359 [Bacillus tianshenii]|uniref:RCK N-terminal domain-containing protein n=1 Tax=Sutcliffiella tianshenii TaxID=1463404 RepID=A0ABS2NV87_9BACI|nr:hypothetical protein [Bacillus tianshenii]MBM7618517.1 hypothetical protein [Bacillus tianshenii]
MFKNWTARYIGFLILVFLFILLAYPYIDVSREIIILMGVYLITVPVIGHLYFKRKQFQLYTFILALVLGIYGFLTEPVKDYSVSNAIYSTFRLFILDVDNVFEPTGSKFVKYPLIIEVARWSAALYTISTIFSLIYSKFHYRLIKWLIGKRGNHIVISGYNSFSELTAIKLTESRYKVVMISEDIPYDRKHELEDKGIFIVSKKMDPYETFRNASVLNAKYCILFHEKESENLDELIALKKLFASQGQLKKRGEQLEIIIHHKGPANLRIIEDIEGELRTENSHYFAIKQINTYKLIADKLFTDFPLYRGYEERVRSKDSEPLHLLCIGFGDTGQHLMLEALERAHFINRKKLKITVLDKAAETLKKEWKRQYPNIDKVGDFQFVPYNNLQQKLDEVVANYDFTHAYICLDQDYADIIEGLEVSKRNKDLPVFVKVNKQGNVSEWIHENTTAFKNLHQFGDLEKVLNTQTLLKEEMSSFAKKTHESYRDLQIDLLNKGMEGVYVPDVWESLNQFTQESNRSTYQHIDTKLMLLGMRAVPLCGEGEEIDFLTFESMVKKSLEDVAAAEHHRWNAFHFLRDWKTMTDKSLPDYPKSESLKQHAALVPWEDLKILEGKLNKSYSFYCRKAIKDLYYILPKDYKLIPYNKGESVDE